MIVRLLRALPAPAPALALTLALACLLAASACTRGGLLPTRPSGVIQPSIEPATDTTGTLQVTRAFAFENGNIRLTVPIEQSVYEGSKSAQKSAIFVGGETPGDWVPDYYRAFVNEKHQAAFYASTLAALRQIRTQQGLDSSRYVELITSMAQTLRYDTDLGALAPKFPIETFGDGFGDCDDKTLLAASLLAREGYDVSILLFQPEKHIALGIRAPGLDYKNTGYAYVEMTEPSLVGIPAEELAGGVKLTSQPVVIKAGDGTKSYEAGTEIAYIQQGLEAIAATEKTLKASTTTLQSELNAEQTSLNAERAALKGIADPAARVPAVERFNARVKAHNAGVADLNRLVARYNSLVAVERYVAGHQTSRPQVYAKVRAAEL